MSPFILCTLSGFVIGIVGAYAIRASASDVEFTPLCETCQHLESRVNAWLVSIVDAIVRLVVVAPKSSDRIVSCDVMSPSRELVVRDN